MIISSSFDDVNSLHYCGAEFYFLMMMSSFWSPELLWRQLHHLNHGVEPVIYSYFPELHLRRFAYTLPHQDKRIHMDLSTRKRCQG